MDKTGLSDYNNTNLQINLFLDHRYQIDIHLSKYIYQVDLREQKTQTL